MNDEPPAHAQLQAMLAVARAHREHERYHSLLKLEHAVSLRRDANTVKVLADRWLEAATGPARAEPEAPTFAAAGCPDPSDRTTVATTGVLFMADGIEPAEPTAMKRRFESTAEEHERLSGRLAGHMAAEWKRLDALLTPAPADAARAR
ncbi:hypothetical protein [Streptomyces sp. NPDC017964]